MDLNALYFHHQLALGNAESGPSNADRETYFELARYYARRISDARSSLGCELPGRGTLPLAQAARP